jgi:FkbM family methyltransferase
MIVQNNQKHYLIRTLRRLGLLKKLSFEYKIKLQNQYFIIPLIEGKNETLLYNQITFKYDLLNKINHIASVHQFLDIGANVGQTLLEVMFFSKTVQYFGFEPNPDCYVLLERLAKANNLEYALFPCACYKSNTIKAISKRSSVDSGARLQHTTGDKNSNNNYIFVNCITLDSIFQDLNLKQNFILKIDVESSELQVLQGSINVIKSLRPIILCEVLHARGKEDFEKVKKHKSKLKNLFYSKRLNKLTKIDNFPTDFYRNSPNTCDFLFLPEEINL